MGHCQLSKFSSSLALQLCNKVKKCVVVVILGLSKAEVVKWCLDNSFELIEMMSEEVEEEDDEEGILIIQYFLIKYNYTIFLY